MPNAAALVVTNARVYTADPMRPWAEALACTGGRIARVGRAKAVEGLIGRDTETMDAGGRLVLPGFIDAHVHLIWGYELGSWIDLTDRPSLRETQRRIAAHAANHPGEEILIGHGFDYASLQPSGLPGKADLDAAVSDRPVLLSAWDGHTGLGNTKFVERALETMASLGREVGQMQRDPRSGEPTGVFHEAFDLTPHLPEVRRRRSLDGLRRTIGTASRLGITTAFDVQVNLADLPAYEAFWKAGELTVRIRAALYHPPDTPRSEYTAFVQARDRPWDDWLRVAAVKLYIDGVQETGTAALLEPYTNNPASRGSTQYPVDTYTSIVEELDRLGFQMCTHACGDRGVRIALDAYEQAGRVNGTSGRRHRIEHCENLSGEDIPRFVCLDVVPCMMPRHSSPDLTTRWREAVGTDRTARGFPWRGLADSGAHLAFASDWPVADLNPLVGVQEAVGRTDGEGGPSPHRLSVRDAIDAYTRGAAYACQAETSRGALVEGFYADFVVLTHDIFERPVDQVREARVVTTAVGGRVVYQESAKSDGPSRIEKEG